MSKPAPGYWHTGCRHVGAVIEVHDRLDSTNAVALALAADPNQAGTVILAREQTAGRGQHGRVWLSSPASSVLLSALVFPPPEVRRPVLLTAWAAVAVCDTVAELCGGRATIKWPNDVLLGGKKVCGILLEQRGGTVAGIGLNVRQPQRYFDDAGLPDATSLRVAFRRRLGIRRVAVCLCRHLDRLYAALERGRFSGLERRWRAGLGLEGKEVCAECHTGEVRGRLRVLSFDAVALEGVNGSLHALQPETIRHLRLVSD